MTASLTSMFSDPGLADLYRAAYNHFVGGMIVQFLIG